jgi:diacylglycerol O-acyltransferase / wax synthase
MPDRLTALDAQFLYMERPTAHMHVGGVSVLDPSTKPDGPLLFDDLKSLVLRRLHLVPRFRQKVVFLPMNVGRPMWTDDTRFDIDFHMRRASLPSPGGHKELADFVQRVHSRPLDRTKPLWEIYFIEGLEGGLIAIYSKTHHAMIDGVSGLDIASVLFDFTPAPREVEPEEWTPEKEPSTAELMRKWVVDSVTHPIEAMAHQASGAVQTPMSLVSRVRTAVGSVQQMLGSGMAPASPFNVPIGPNRRFSFTDVPVDDAKAVKNALGGTVNDVILTGVAGMLRRVLIARGEPTTNLSMRAMVPVSTRDESQKMALGNRVSMFFIDLPVGDMEPAERLHRITAETRNFKESGQAIGAASIMGLTRWAPPTLHALAARLVVRQRFANLVVTNVPGPQVPLYLLGARLEGMYPLMNLTETMALMVAITSLSGNMGFGFTGDWDAVPDIDDLPDHLQASMSELKKAAGV